jgi:hypothetical protein
MITRMMIVLSVLERDALCKLAQGEFRDPRAQAAFIIRQELVQCGQLTAKSESPAIIHPSTKPNGVQDAAG